MKLSKHILLTLFNLYHKQVVAEHQLKCLIWECTLKCNLSCKHCGSDCTYNNEMRDMPYDDFVTALDALEQHIPPQKLRITFSGGEPLLRTDLIECGKDLTLRGYSWGMVTNGLLLTQRKIAELADAGLKSISISLDGLESYHNHFRGNSNSYQRVIEALKELKKYPSIFTSVVTCVTPENIDQLESLKVLLLDDITIGSWRLYPIFPIGRASLDSSLLLQTKQLHGLLGLIKQYRESGYNVKFSCEGFLGDYEGTVRPHFYNCMAGVSVASIRVNGDISGCNSIRYNYSEGNIYKDNLWEVWQTGFNKYRNRSWAKSDICSKCKVFRYCLGGGMHLRDKNGEIVQCLYNKLH